jgi:hypothetical protein
MREPLDDASLRCASRSQPVLDVMDRRGQASRRREESEAA